MSLTKSEEYLKKIYESLVDPTGFLGQHNENERFTHTQFSEKKIAEKTQQFILNANLPISTQRDVITTANGGTVTDVGAEFRVRATSANNSSSLIRSKRRGNYISGNVAEAGLGVRLPSQPTGDANIKWGYYLNDGGTLTGIYYRYDADGIWTVIEDNGVIVEETPFDQWNQISRSGKLEPEAGNIWQLTFVYYGYGPFVFEGSYSRDLDYGVKPMHLYKRRNSISLSEPNLPLTVEVNSGTSGQQLDAFLGGRQFSTFGKQVPQTRDVGSYRNAQGSIGTTFVPTVSARHKSSLKNIVVYLNNLTMKPSGDAIVEIVKNPTLTGANWTVAKRYNNSETATEWDTQATATTGGETIRTYNLKGGNQVPISVADLPERIIGEDDTVSVNIASRGSTISNDTHLNLNELW